MSDQYCNEHDRFYGEDRCSSCKKRVDRISLLEAVALTARALNAWHQENETLSSMWHRLDSALRALDAATPQRLRRRGYEFDRGDQEWKAV